jgi:hypothetical protein
VVGLLDIGVSLREEISALKETISAPIIPVKTKINSDQ